MLACFFTSLLPHFIHRLSIKCFIVWNPLSMCKTPNIYLIQLNPSFYPPSFIWLGEIGFLYLPPSLQPKSSKEVVPTNSSLFIEYPCKFLLLLVTSQINHDSRTHQDRTSLGWCNNIWVSVKTHQFILQFIQERPSSQGDHWCPTY